MPIDLNVLVPIINATGIPILIVGVLLLLKAYQKSVESYKDLMNAYRDSSTDSNNQLNLLKDRLRKVDDDYVRLAERVNSAITKGSQSIEELEARKVLLLSKPDETPKSEIISDVTQINEAIALIRELSVFNRDELGRLHEEVSRADIHYSDLTDRIGRIAETIGDVKSRLIVVGLVSSKQSLDEIQTLLGNQKRGLVISEDVSEENEANEDSPVFNLPAPSNKELPLEGTPEFLAESEFQERS